MKIQCNIGNVSVIADADLNFYRDEDERGKTVWVPDTLEVFSVSVCLPSGQWRELAGPAEGKPRLLAYLYEAALAQAARSCFAPRQWEWYTVKTQHA